MHRENGTINIEKPKLILGEGIDEKVVLEHIVSVEGLSNDIQVEQYSGKDNLRNFLGAMLKTKGRYGLRRLLVTRDADDDFTAAFNSTSSHLRKLGINPPSSPGEWVQHVDTDEGLDFELGVQIFPGNLNTGSLETVFLAPLLGTERMDCIDALVDCLKRSSIVLGQLDKARMKTWLATNPQKPLDQLGTAVKKNLFDIQDQSFAELRNLLRQL